MIDWLRWLASVLLGMIGGAMRWMGERCLDLAARMAVVVVDEEAPGPAPPPPPMRRGLVRRQAGRPPEHWVRMVRERAPHLVQDDGGVRMTRFGRQPAPPPPAPPSRGRRRWVSGLHAERGGAPASARRPSMRGAIDAAAGSAQAGGTPAEATAPALSGRLPAVPMSLFSALRAWRRRIESPLRDAPPLRTTGEVGAATGAAPTIRTGGDAHGGAPGPASDGGEVSPSAETTGESPPPSAPARGRPPAPRRPHRLVPSATARTRPGTDSPPDHAAHRRPAGPARSFAFGVDTDPPSSPAYHPEDTAAPSHRAVSVSEQGPLSRPDRRAPPGDWIPYRRRTSSDRLAPARRPLPPGPWTEPPSPAASAVSPAPVSAAEAGIRASIGELPGRDGVLTPPWPDLPPQAPSSPPEPMDLDRYTQQRRHRARLDAEQEGLSWNG